MLLFSLSMRGASSFAAGLARRVSSPLRMQVEGEYGTAEYAKYLLSDDGKPISYWHDVPISPEGAAAGVYNFVSEIPKYEKAKMEVATKLETNPIKQDMKKGKVRYYHGPIFWNYGCIPQTWEDPSEEHPELKCFGDNDPIDVVEIGSKAIEEGTVSGVKALGVLAMIDDGELDWKVVAISESDPMYDELNDISDVEAKMPGVVSGIREWFRWYKTPDDKPLNAFGFDEACLPQEKAIEVIAETHAAWKALRDGAKDADGLWLSASSS